MSLVNPPSVVQKRGIVTMEARFGQEKCSGKRVADIQDGTLRQALYQAAKSMISNYRKEGLEFIDKDDVHAYGPYPNQEMLMPMLNTEAMTTTDHFGLVLDKAESNSAFASYLLVANFKSGALALPKGVIWRS